MNTSDTTTTASARPKRLQPELLNAIKKLEVIEAQLERTLLQLERTEFGDYASAVFSDIRYAKDKTIDAREALQNHI